MSTANVNKDDIQFTKCNIFQEEELDISVNTCIYRSVCFTAH